MRKLAIYIRSIFCKHDWEFLGTTACWNKNMSTEMPAQYIDRWRCKKCGYIVKDKY